jgi:hypothetical protein
VQLAKVPTFSRIRVRDIGSVGQIEGVPDTIDDVLPVWTKCTRDENPFATVEIRGVIDSAAGLVWLPDDAEVDIVEGPKYAGQPEELIKQVTPVKAPAGSQGAVASPEGWPQLIWESDIVHSPVQGWTDAEISVEVLMCALTVAPNDDPLLRPMLLAGLAARYANLVKHPRTYPPEKYPWRGRTEPAADFLEYLEG